MEDIEGRLRRRHGRLPDPDLRRRDTALLVIDMQYGDAHREHGLLRRMRERGDGAAAEYYATRVETQVIPNIRRLQEACRQAGVEVIHTKIESLTRDGRDRSLEHKHLGIHHPPGSKDAQILEEVRAQGRRDRDHQDVRRGLQRLEHRVRPAEPRHPAPDRGRRGDQRVRGGRGAGRGGPQLPGPAVEDATATWSDDMHRAAMRAMDEIYAKVLPTSEMLARLEALTAAAVR